MTKASTLPILTNHLYYGLAAPLVGLVFAARAIGPIQDDSNYSNHFEFGLTRLTGLLDEVAASPLKLFSEEPLWFWFSGTVGQWLGPELGMRATIFASVTIILYALARYTGRPWLVLGLFLLLYPLTKNYVLHLRQGAAMAIFYLGWSLPGYKGTLLRWLSPFVHVSMWFVITADLFLNMASRLNLSWGPRPLFFSMIAAVLGLSAPLLAALSADRRLAVYEFSMPQISGLGTIVIASILIYVLMFSDRSRSALMVTMGASVYLTTLPFLDFGMRVFESFTGFLVLSVITFRNLEQWIYISALSVYGLLIWVNSSSGGPFLRTLVSPWIE